MADLRAISLKLTTDGVGKVENDLGRVKTATGRFREEANLLSRALVTLGGAGAMGALVKASFDAAMAQERLDSMFKATTGSANLAAREIAFIREESSRLGLEFKSASESYGRFMASIKGTSLEGMPGREIFTGVSEAVAALQLDASTADRIFLQLQQMASKGRVTAEDLNVLGEALPGVRQKIIDALGTSGPAFSKLMADGKALASDILPALGEELHRSYGDAAVEASEKAQGGINRTKNEIRELMVLLSADATSAFGVLLNDGIVPLVSGLKEVVRWFSESAIQKRYFLRSAGIVMNSGDGFNRWLTESGRSEISAELDAQKAMTQYELDQLHKRMYPQSSQKSASETAEEQARNAARARQEQAAAAAAAAKASAAEQAAQQELNAYIREYNRLQDERNKAKLDQNPYLTDHEKTMAQLVMRYDDLLSRYPQHRAELERNLDLDRQNLENLRALNLEYKKRVEIGALADETTTAMYDRLFTPIKDKDRSATGRPGSLMGGEFDLFGDKKGMSYSDFQKQFGTQEQKDFYGTVDTVDAINASGMKEQDPSAYWAAIEEAYKQHSGRMDELEKARAENAILTAANMMDGLAAMLMQGSKEQFEIGKGLAIATAIIETFAAAQKAYSAMAAIPVAGPTLGAAAAATAIAMGMARVAMIESQEYNPRRALGGPVYAGDTYWVGERGPEPFTPAVNGWISPNGSGGGGQSVSVTNVFNIAPGANSETIRAELMGMMPMIEKRTVGAVQSAIDSGKPIARSVGRG